MNETNTKLKEIMKSHGMRTYAHQRNQDLHTVAQYMRVSPGAVKKWLSGERRMPEGALELLEIKLMLKKSTKKSA